MAQYLVSAAVFGMLAVYTAVIYKFGYNFGRLERTVELTKESIQKTLDNRKKF